MGPMAATAVITLVPVLILVWALQKKFRAKIRNGCSERIGKEHEKEYYAWEIPIHGGMMRRQTTFSG